MTIERTRQLLGSEVEHMTDDQVQQMTDDAKHFCKAFIETVIKQIKP